MIKSLFLFITFSILLCGCSLFGGDKETRKPVADGLTPKTLYELAEDKFSSGSIEQGIEQLEVILSAYPGSKYAIQARLDIAYNLFKRKKYNRAILELNKFIERYPTLPSTPYAYYLRGIIAEEKSSSILDVIITDICLLLERNYCRRKIIINSRCNYHRQCAERCAERKRCLWFLRSINRYIP